MTKRQMSVAGVSVMLAMPVHRALPWQTARSLVETQSLMQAKGIGFDIEMQVGSSLVHHARNKLAARFLASTHTHLFWVDSDMEWAADDFLRFVAMATEMTCLCGAYAAKRDPITIFLGEMPTEVETNEFGCFPVSGAGLGFTVVNRQIMELLSEAAPKAKFPDSETLIPYIFRTDLTADGYARGEDMAFFSDVADLGHSVMLDPNVSLGHVGEKTFTGTVAAMLEPQTDNRSKTND